MSTEAAPLGASGCLRAFSLLAAHQPSRTPVVSLSGARHCACAGSTPTNDGAPCPLSCSRPFLLFGAHVTWPRRGLATLACVCRVQLVGAQARTDAPSTALKQGKTTEDAADAARSLWPGNDPCDTLRAGPMRVEGPLVVLGSIYLVWRRSPSYVERGGHYARQRSVWTGKSSTTRAYK